MKPSRIGVVTGGGDTSALNPTIRGIVDRAAAGGIEVVGFMGGWAGLLADGQAVRLTPEVVDPTRGGTLLKTSRTKLAGVADGYRQARDKLRQLGIDALIPIGGDDTLSVAADLGDVPMVVVTKTIDNDVGTNPPDGEPIDFSRMVNYFTPGFPSAARRVAEFASAAGGVRTTAYSHERIIVLETMGMSAGWLALAAAWGHADIILAPEAPLDYERLKAKVVECYRVDREVIISVAEGVVDAGGKPICRDESNRDAFGHAKVGGVADVLARRLKADLGEELGTRNFNAVIPSYLYRSGSPTDVDRQIALKLGGLAVELVLADKLDHIACVARVGDDLDVTGQPFSTLQRQADGSIKPRRVDPRFYDAQGFAITPAGEDYFRPILGPRHAAPEKPNLEEIV